MIQEIARKALGNALHVTRFLSEQLLPDGVPDIIHIPRHEKINNQIKWLQEVAEKSLPIKRDQPNLKELGDNIRTAMHKDGTPLDSLDNVADGYKIGKKYVWFNYTFNTNDVRDSDKPWEMRQNGFTITVSDDYEKHSNSDPGDGHTFDSFTPKGQIKSICVNETKPEGIFHKYEPRTLRVASMKQEEGEEINFESWSEVLEAINEIVPSTQGLSQK